MSVAAPLAGSEMVAFEARTCPNCGHYEPPTPVEPGQRIVPCGACGAAISAQALFCPSCGNEPGYEGAPEDISLEGLDDDRPGGEEKLALLVVALAPTLILIAAGAVWLVAL